MNQSTHKHLLEALLSGLHLPVPVECIPVAVLKRWGGKDGESD